jgi:hypothetical protein
MSQIFTIYLNLHILTLLQIFFFAIFYLKSIEFVEIFNNARTKYLTDMA